MYRDLIRRIFKMRSKRVPASQEEGLSKMWCDKNQISRVELYTRLSLIQSESFDALFGKTITPRHDVLNEKNIIMGGGGDYSLLHALAEKLQACHVVETGVAMGYSSLALLLSVSKRNGTVYSTDRPYPLKNYDKYVGYLVPDQFHDHWKLFRMPDRDGLKKVFRLCNQFELIHYDSDKSKAGRLWGYHQLWSKLREGGVFVSDDIADNLAFKEFCNAINKEPIILKKGRNYLGVIEK